jgi:formate dehydrogenase subunit gamma
MSELANSKGGAPTDRRVVRHELFDRFYHWSMATCVLLLIGTAFLPILGIKFSWLDIHWMTGVALTALVVIHIVRALFFQDWRNMWIGLSDLRDLWRSAIRLLGAGGKSPALPGKYDAAQKLYHLGVIVLVLAVIGSGLLMLTKIDTPFWQRNPYWLSANTWGIIYVIHGMAAMAIVSIVIIHIYFAFVPDTWYLSPSMLRGWISRGDYSRHHDPARWKA